MSQPNNLKKPLNEVSVDQKFIVQAHKMGIDTLNDMLEMCTTKLKGHPDFTNMWYTSMLQILEREQLMEVYQEKLFKK